jgi:hypothetical protein
MRVGRWEVEAELGRGAAGSVHRVRDDAGRLAALKLLRGAQTASPTARARFLREAELLGRFRHPGVVSLLDAGEHEGAPYLVVELAEGGTLAERVARDGPFPENVAAELVAAVAAALDHAHREGIVHRDVKPENVLLGADGAPRLADFGLARDLDPEASRLSASGMILGTPTFMAPEQGRGEAAGPPADVYGLGGLLFVALTGRATHKGDDLLGLLRDAQAPRTPPSRLRPGLAPALDALCLRCLAHAPAERPTAAEVGQALAAFLGGAPPDRPGWGRRRVAAAAAGALLVVLVASAGGWFALERSWRADVARELAALEAEGLLPSPEDSAGVPDALPLLEPLLAQLDCDPSKRSLESYSSPPTFPYSIDCQTLEPDGLRWLLVERTWLPWEAAEEARDAVEEEDRAHDVVVQYQTKEEHLAGLRGVVAWVDAHEAALDAALAAGGRLGSSAPMAPTVDIARALEHRQLIYALLARSAWRTLEPDPDGAWADLSRVLAVTLLRDEPFVMTVRFRREQMGLVLTSLVQTLRRVGPPTPARRKALTEQLLRLEDRAALRRCFGGEVAQHVRLDAEALLEPYLRLSAEDRAARTGVRARLLRERWRRGAALQLSSALRLILAAPADAPGVPAPALRELFGSDASGLMEVGFFAGFYDWWVSTVALVRLARAALALGADGLRPPAERDLPMDPWRQGQRLRWDREGRGLVLWSVGQGAVTTYRDDDPEALTVHLALPPPAATPPPAPAPAPAPPPPPPPARTPPPPPELVDAALQEAERSLDALVLLRLRALLEAPLGDERAAESLGRALAVVLPADGLGLLEDSAQGLTRLRDELRPRLADPALQGADERDPEREASLLAITADEGRDLLAQARAELRRRWAAAPTQEPLAQALRAVHLAAHVALVRHVSLGAELDRARELIAREGARLGKERAARLEGALGDMSAAVDVASAASRTAEGAERLRAALDLLDSSWSTIEQTLARTR